MADPVIQSFQSVTSKRDVKDPHFEAISQKATVGELHRQRVTRRTLKIEEQLNKDTVDLGRLKQAVWTGVPSRKYAAV